MAEPIANLPGELWKPVVGYEGFYEISNMGRVKSLARINPFPNRWGTMSSRLLRERILRPVTIGHRGIAPRQVRHAVNLSMGGRSRVALLHRLVLEAFVGPCPDGMECCHNDGVASNNRIENLRWDTHAGNLRDKIAHGTSQHGERNARAKLTDAAVEVIRRERGVIPQRVLAAMFGVDQSTICLAQLGETWGRRGT